MDSNSLDGSGSTYVAQLHQVFSGCDSSGTGYLGRPELVELCAQLHLDEQSNLVLGHLLGDDPEAKVDFDEFKEKFVYLLAHSVQDNEIPEPASHQEAEDEKEDVVRSIRFSSRDREVSPKYVWGSKTYGRRSRPDGGSNEADEDFFLSDASDSEVFVDPSPVERDLQEERKTTPSSVELDSNVVALTTVRPRASSFSGKIEAKRRRRMRSSEDTKYLASSDAADRPGTEEDDNEEDYLRSIWLKLGVGSDGFLDQEGLTQVCKHIGMEKMSEEVVSQLFDKLDVDQDGRIHFDEFLHLFRTGEATASTGHTTVHANQSPVQHKKLDDSSVPHAERQTSSSSSSLNAVTSTGGNPNESGIFSSLDLYNTGYAEPEAVWELWDSLGIAEGHMILKELGFCTNSQVCLLDLTNVLEDILQNASDPEFCHVAFLTYDHNLKFLRRTVHQLKLERDYLLMDVADANSRATLIAQEVDENQAKLEQKSQENIANLGRKYHEQMRRLKEELESEQEQWSEQILKLKRELQEEVNARQDLEMHHREQLAELEKEMKETSKEKQKLEKKLSEVERDNERRLEALSQLRPKDEEKSYEGRCQSLAAELDMYKSTNKQLQDKNDELNARVEELESQLPSKLNLEVAQCHDRSKTAVVEEDEDGVLVRPPRGHRRSGSCLSDYIKTTPAAADRRGGTGPLAGTVPDTDKHGTDKESKFATEKEGESVRNDCSFIATNDWSPDEEYLTYRPKSAPRNVLFPIEMQDSVNKLQVKQVFSVLKRRFIENYLEEMENNTSDNDTAKRAEGGGGGIAACDGRRIRPQFSSACPEIQCRNQIAAGCDDLEVSIPVDYTCEHLPMTMDVTVASSNESLRSPALETSAKVSSDSGFDDINSAATTPLKFYAGTFCGIEEDGENEDVDTDAFAEDEARSVLREEVARLKEQWQTVLDGEREKWMELVLSMESHHKELQDKLKDEEVSHKGKVLQSEVFWREQVEQERLEQEQERVDLVDKILGLELQLETAKKKQWPRITRDVTFDDESGDDDDAVVGHCDDSSVRRSRSWRESQQHSTESTRRCLSGRSTRDRRAKKPKQTSLDNVSFDTDSLDGHSGDLSQLDCCKHQAPCCAKLNQYKSLLRNSNKQIESLQMEIRWLQQEFLTRGTSLQMTTSRSAPRLSSERPNCVIDVEMLHAINQHVKQQEQRCRQLEATMATKTLQAEKELVDARRFYDDELRRVTQLLAKSKGLLKEHSSKAREQNEKLLQSDLLIKELYIENAQLMKTVQILEQKNEIGEKTNFNLQQKYLALNKLLTEMCRVPPATTSSSA